MKSFILVVVFALVSGATNAEAANPVCGNRQGCIFESYVELRGLQGVGVTFMVNGSAEDVWQLISDCESWPRYLAFVAFCNKQEGDYNLAIDIFSMKHVFVGRLVVNEANHEMEFHRLRGDFSELHGLWTVEDAGNSQVKVRYIMSADAGPLIPDALTRRYLRDLLPEVVSGVEKWAQRKARQ